MSGTPMSVPCQYPMRLFGIGVTCSDRIALIVVFKWFEFYRFFLEHEKIPFFLTGKTVRIEPATSLFIISHPVCDAIVRR